MSFIPNLLRLGSLQEVFPVVIRLLRLFKAWDKHRRVFGLYGFFLFHFCFRLLPLFIYLDASDMHSLMKTLGECVFVSMLYPVFIVYVWKLPKIVLLLNTLRKAFAHYCNENQSAAYRKTIVKTNRFVRNICRFYFIYTGANIPVYIVAPVLLTFYKYYIWNDPQQAFYFKFPNELPYLNHYNVWHYVACETLIAPIFLFSAVFLALKSMLYYSLIKYVSLMFELVIQRIQLLDRLDPSDRKSNLEREVDGVVRSHLLALRCAQLLEEIISPILLAQFLGCVIVWCLLILYITTSSGDMGAITTLILCEIVAFEMLAFSFFGSELTHVSNSIAHEIYSFRWYDAPISVQKKVLLIAVRSQRTVGVTALKFYFVSIEQFGKAVQTTYSFYLVMKNLFSG